MLLLLLLLNCQSLAMGCVCGSAPNLVWIVVAVVVVVVGPIFRVGFPIFTYKIFFPYHVDVVVVSVVVVYIPHFYLFWTIHPLFVFFSDSIFKNSNFFQTNQN
jgi:hypothetical protein